MSQVQEIWNKVAEFFVDHGIDFLLGLFVLVVGLIIVKVIGVICKKIASKSKTDGAVASFIISLIMAILDIIIIIAALSIMGLNLASILTVVATGGVAIGLALKDSLGNVASGFIIIVNKPFKKGDYIMVGGVEGKINKINLFNTILTTWDNKVVVVPNSVAVNNPLTNCDTASTRRVDLELGFEYGIDIDEARKIIATVLETDERVSIEQPYQIVLTTFKDSSVCLSVRAWTDTDQYWSVKFDLQEKIYNALYSQGITFAYNHITVNTAKENNGIPSEFRVKEFKPSTEDYEIVNEKKKNREKVQKEKANAKNKKKTTKEKLEEIIDSSPSDLDD